MDEPLTHRELRQLLRYCPETGDFYWLVDGSQPIGKSGFRGVTVKRRLSKPYVAQFGHGKSRQHIGCFATGIEAESAYLAVANSIKGQRAGTQKADGYWRIKIGRREYGAHRLAWFYMMGEWPEPTVDHRDLDRGNNRWSNLRQATRSQNAANTKPRSQFKGVSRKYPFAKRQFEARIIVNGKSIGLGSYYTAEEAHAAYAAAARTHFGEFARVS